VDQQVAGSIPEIASVGQSTAHPDPALLQAIGLNHSLGSAVADLVDNGIDAGANRVLVRFVIRGGLATQLIVLDNGRGMNNEQIDAAMVLGVRRDRAEDSLGHFGMGLKAASFSQASTLTVLTRSPEGSAGRRMPRQADKEWSVFELEAKAVADALDGNWGLFEVPTGTAVVWDDIRTFPTGSDTTVTNDFIERAVSELRNHLGLVLHRLLESQRIRVQIDVFDADEEEAGFPFEVDPIDPFGYSRPGSDAYPKTLVTMVSSSIIELHCHLWPPRSDSKQFKLAGKSLTEHQGFYLYRNNRLLLDGGWAGVATAHNRRRLARVSVEIDGLGDLFQMSMEKSGVILVPELVQAIESALASDGTTFEQYLAAAEEVLSDSNRKQRATRTEMLPPGSGLAPRVKRRIGREIPLLEAEDPVEIRWRRFETDDFVEVDRPNQTLWLNEAYRSSLLKGARGGLNDAPLTKALLYLVYEDIFRGTFFGPKDKDNVQLWREILNAAAQEEERMYGE